MSGKPNKPAGGPPMGGPGHGPGGRHARAMGGKPKETKQTIKRLLGYLGKDKKHVIIALVCVVISSLSTLAGSYMLSPIINGITETYDKASKAAGGAGVIINEGLKTLGLGILLMLAIYGIGVISMYLQQRIMIGVSQRALKTLRKDLFDHIQTLPVRYFDTNATGDIMSRFTNDVDTVQEALNGTFSMLIQSFLILTGTLSMLFVLSARLTLIVLLFLAASGFFIWYNGKRSKKYFNAQQEALAAVNGFVEEMISGQKTLRAYSQEENTIKKLDKQNDETVDAYYRADYYGSMVGPSVNFVNNLSLSLVSFFGALLFLGGSISIGNISSFVLYSRKFSGPINEIANIIGELQSAFSAAERVFRLLDEEPEVADSPNAEGLTEAEGDVDLSHVNFGYTKDRQIIKDLSLHVPKGALVAIVGPTGAGKTTIINLLMRFYDVDSGEITLDHKPIKDLTRRSLRLNYSMVLQDTWLFTGTVYENIAYGSEKATREDVERVCKACGIHDYIRTLPDGYETVLEDDGANISKGQKQLMTIARAMLLESSLLILDEATSNVDTRTELRIQKAMRTLMADKTCFVIAHRLSTIRNADMILVVRDGEIVERGTHESLMQGDTFYRHLYNAQFA